MPTALFSHPACLDHDTGPYHPESTDRLAALLQALDDDAFAALQRRAAPAASRDQILRAHSAAHFDRVQSCRPVAGAYRNLDPDTVMSEGSWEAALRAAGAVIAAVDAVLTGECRNAFCAVRPPGHHADANRAMGFCLFNNIAIGALHARAMHGFERIAVIDVDVHHGNGTQDIFYDDAGLFYASTHQRGAFPGTGLAAETGVAGNIVNVPLPAGTGSTDWRAAVEAHILPALRRFAPQLIMISMGFDAHLSDPLAQMRLTADDYRWVTAELCAVAAEACQNRLVSVLEGGYDLRALALSGVAHLQALMGN